MNGPIHPTAGHGFASAVALLLMTLLGACGGGGGSAPAPLATAPPTATPAPQPEPDADTDAGSCGVESQKDFVLETANAWYRWYDELAPVDRDAYDSAGALLAALTAPLAEDFRDPGFSFLTTVEADRTSLSTGAYVGFGFRFAIDTAGRYLISDVFESGSAYDAGFARGAELLAIDRGAGFASFRDLEDQGASLSEVFGPATIGLERGFRLAIADEVVEVRIAKTELEIPPLAETPGRLERPGLDPVAYLHLRRFISAARDDLEDRFEALAGDRIDDYIIDLRYNNGGSVTVAEYLLDLLGGVVASDAVAFRTRHNDQRRDEDTEKRFRSRDASVRPLRIAFITSGATASASEILINSLAPQVEVALIGSDTFGKAVGQYAFDQPGCATRLRLVTFDTVNGDGLGDFYTGLADTGRFTLCPVPDTYRGAFGTREDPLTAAALNWLNEGACNVSSSAAASMPRALHRGPAPLAGRAAPDRRSSWIQ